MKHIICALITATLVADAVSFGAAQDSAAERAERDAHGRSGRARHADRIHQARYPLRHPQQLHRQAGVPRGARVSAAAAVRGAVAAHHELARQGYGLLIHDGYRPWAITKLFWESRRPAQREFVADPASGSKHNRGCAVDLTMYDRRPGRPSICRAV